MLEFLEEPTIILEKATISRKCQNYLKMIEFQENVRLAKNSRKILEKQQFLENSTISLDITPLNFSVSAVCSGLCVQVLQ